MGGDCVRIWCILGGEKLKRSEITKKLKRSEVKEKLSWVGFEIRKEMHEKMHHPHSVCGSLLLCTVMLYCSNAHCTIQLLQKIVQYCSNFKVTFKCIHEKMHHPLSVGVWWKQKIFDCKLLHFSFVHRRVVVHYSLVQIAVSLHRNVSLNMCTPLQFCANCTNCATTCANNLCKLHRNVSPHRCRPGPDLPLLPSCCPTRYMIKTTLWCLLSKVLMSFDDQKRTFAKAQSSISVLPRTRYMITMILWCLLMS